MLIVNTEEKCLAKLATGNPNLIMGPGDHNAIDCSDGCYVTANTDVFFPSTVGILFWKSHYSQCLKA